MLKTRKVIIAAAFSILVVGVPLSINGCSQEAAVENMNKVEGAQTVFFDKSENRKEQKGKLERGAIKKAGPGETVITYVNSPENGDIAVKIVLPEKSRYEEGAPVIVDVATFFTVLNGFHQGIDVTEIGGITVYYLWPGKEDVKTGSKSEGEYDFGGPNCIAALRSVVRFAAGLQPNVEGRYIHEILEVNPLKNNVGIYAFSHPGIAATNVLALYGSEIASVKYFVGRENPTIDEMYALEPGYFNEKGEKVMNPYYHPELYSSKSINIDYSKAGWIQNENYPEGRPYFDVEDGEDFVLSEKRPEMWGKSYYSRVLTKALLENGALTMDNWPENVATPEEAEANWPYRTTVNNYDKVGKYVSNLKVMLVFATDDHVQAADDKPHIRQAYDGFKKTARLWTRLNPDRSYVEDIAESVDERPLKNSGLFPDNDANTEPADWMLSGDFGYKAPFAGRLGTQLVPMAAIAEMADRVRANNWNNNLDGVLYGY